MFRKSLVLLCCFYHCLLITLSHSQEVEGGQCLTRTSQPGICIILSKCPAIENDILHDKYDHVGCGFVGLEQIVCCPNKQPIVTSRESTPTARISARKCSEYKEFAYPKYYVTNGFGRPPLEIIDYTCAFTAVPLIVGGTEADKKEFPHMALIGYRVNGEIRFVCGGTLISEQFVLTAAHCINVHISSAALVRLGEHDLNRTDEAAHIDVNVIERIIHPEFKAFYNDIGLLKMERQVMLNIAIRPACLPEKSSVPTETAIATGWGKVEWGGKTSNVLLEVTVDIFSQNYCNNSIRHRLLSKGIDDESQVCAGSYTGTKDACDGDSGGPLQIYHETHNCSYTIVGVTSFGKICGTIGVYTRVYAYLSWIEDIVWPNQ